MNTTAPSAEAATTTDQRVRLVALGGLGEIGLNCFGLERNDSGQRQRLLIDCGALFRDGEWGIDAYGPRLDWLLDEPDALSGVALTHGHEDHIGALWTLAATVGPLRSQPIVVAGPPYAIELCRVRAEEYDVMRRYLQLQPVAVGSRFRVGPWSLRSIRMTHSTPDASALAIDTPAGRVVHSGDFKLDPSPRHGLPSDTDQLAALGDEGVRLLLADSTNALAEGRTRSEAVAAAALERLMQGAPQRVVVGLFASNVQRLDAAAMAARACGRSVCLLGRSLRTHVEVSRRLGLLSWPSDLLVAPEVARDMPRDRLAYLVTGTQGEPRAALRRIASGQHGQLRLQQGDQVLLSSRIIPGCERAVVALTNDLEAQGVTVIGRLEAPDIHVSGHARRGELSELLELLRPEAFVPLHGTSSHLRAHATLARELGIEHVRELRNGQSLYLSTDQIEAAEPIDAGLIGYRAGHAEQVETLRARQRLGRYGVLVAALSRPNRVALKSLGLALEPDALEPLAAMAEQVWRDLPPGQDSPEQALEAVRRALRRALAEQLGYKPPVEMLPFPTPIPPRF